jgi:hypothetical protein
MKDKQMNQENVVGPWFIGLIELTSLQEIKK